MLESRVGIALNLLENSAYNAQFDLQRDKLVLFSDFHRGVGDEADDYFACQEAYRKALGHYYKEGFSIGLLGDVEELWENDIDDVLKNYPKELELESRFYREGRYFRIFGNHDELWRVEAEVNKHFGEKMKGLMVHELMKMKVVSGEKEHGEIFLAHGHQGSVSSDSLAVISRFFVRTVWRWIQLVFKIKLTSPSNNLRLRSRLDRSLHKWASKRKRTLVICGHTHQPVFMSRTHIDEIYGQIREEKAKGQKADESKIEALIKKIAQLKKEQTQLAKYDKADKPCYFNTGCCSFSDGQITGLELDKEMIRLIRWDRAGGRKVLAERSLVLVLERCD